MFRFVPVRVSRSEYSKEPTATRAVPEFRILSGVAFRRHQLEASLDEFLKHYNFERPHQGYRTRGRTSAETFWDAIARSASQEA